MNINFRRMTYKEDRAKLKCFPTDYHVTFHAVATSEYGNTMFKLMVRDNPEDKDGYANEAEATTCGASPEQLLKTKHNVLLACLINMTDSLKSQYGLKTLSYDQLDKYADELLIDLEQQRIDLLAKAREMMNNINRDPLPFRNTQE